MPTYVYHCDTCNTNFEKFQKFSEEPLTECLQGHEGVRRVITPSAIIFKGSGWYITDSKAGSNGGSTTASKTVDNSSTKSSEGSESKSEGSSESKSESTSESKEAKPESKSSTEAA